MSAPDGRSWVGSETHRQLIGSLVEAAPPGWVAKRRLTLAWLKESQQPVEVITDLDGADFGLLLPHTSDLTTAQFASLCEWILAFGTTNGVTFRDPKQPK